MRAALGSWLLQMCALTRQKGDGHSTRLTIRLEGTTPNSTAMLPFTLNLHRKTGWSNVVRSDTSSLGPILCRETVMTDPAGLVSEVKPAVDQRKVSAA